MVDSQAGEEGGTVAEVGAWEEGQLQAPHCGHSGCALPEERPELKPRRQRGIRVKNLEEKAGLEAEIWQLLAPMCYSMLPVRGHSKCMEGNTGKQSPHDSRRRGGAREEG